MRVSIVLSASLFFCAACGSDPCHDYCDTACKKAIVCMGEIANDDEVDECVDACTTNIEAIEDAQDMDAAENCEESEQQVRDMTCDELLDAMGY